MPNEAWLVVGLGNPGAEYAGNRHNVGFQVVDALASRDGGRFRAHKTRAAVLEGHLGDRRVVFAKPSTFMNDSGGQVAALCGFFDVPVERLVVVHDELDLDFGVVRLKSGGGDNGHNGLRSITRSVRSNGYFRIRFGIGRPPGRMDPATFVLANFSGGERKDLLGYLETAADCTFSIVRDGGQPRSHNSRERSE